VIRWWRVDMAIRWRTAESEPPIDEQWFHFSRYSSRASSNEKGSGEVCFNFSIFTSPEATNMGPDFNQGSGAASGCVASKNGQGHMRVTEEEGSFPVAYDSRSLSVCLSVSPHRRTTHVGFGRVAHEYSEKQRNSPLRSTISLPLNELIMTQSRS